MIEGAFLCVGVAGWLEAVSSAGARLCLVPLCQKAKSSQVIEVHPVCKFTQMVSQIWSV